MPLASPVAAPLLLAAAVAWMVTIASSPGAEIGLMGMSPEGYLGAWTLMTAAMMLPALAWFASRYHARLGADRGPAAARCGTWSLVAGYAAVWAAVGASALAVAAGFQELHRANPSAMPWVGGAVLILAGAYQLSPLKEACLTRCRSPIAFALRAGRIRGRFRDLRMGVLHAGWCVACCWPLMVVLVAVGAMDLRWMAGLAAVILLERSPRLGGVARAGAGALLIVAGALVPWVGWIAPALHALPMGMGG